MGSYKYPLLNNEDWLREQYLVHKRSTNEIAFLVGARSANSARQALLRFNISVCSTREGLTRNRVEDGFVDNRSVIDGCLLGDGCLSFSYRQSHNACPYFKKRNKHHSHTLFVAQQLFTHLPENRITKTVEKFRNLPFTIFSLRSLSHPKLVPYYERWYASGKKAIPHDLIVNETLLLHWFLDDGSSYLRRPESATHQVVICFSSECFHEEDQQRLCTQINERFNLHAKVASCNSGTGKRIVLAQSQAFRFFSIIGPPPVPELAYKWKLPTSSQNNG